MFTFISNSEKDTMNIAYKLASFLEVGDVVVLSRRFGLW